MLFLNVHAAKGSSGAGKAIGDARRTAQRNMSPTAQLLASRSANRGMGVARPAGQRTPNRTMG